MLARVVERDSWKTREKFKEITNYTDRQIEHLHADHPELFKWKTIHGVDSVGRTIRRGALINIDGFYALHTSILKTA